MKATTYYSSEERCDIITLSISDIDKMKALDSTEILREVRYLIAEQIVSRIMEKLSPALDKLLTENKV